MTQTNALLAGPTAKPAPADHPIHELLKARWSPRAFAPAPIDDATLRTLLEAARWAPSTSNEQPWSFVIAQRADTADFARMLACLAPNNQIWAQHAAVLMISVLQIHKPGKDVVAVNAPYDLGQSVAHMSVQATALGIAVHQMGGFDAAKAQEVLSVPATHRCVTALAFGYPAPAEQLPDPFREREAAPRVRNALASFAFNGTWGKSI